MKISSLFIILMLVISPLLVGCSEEKKACIESGGEWKKFSTECADTCLYHMGKKTDCTSIEIYSCDCGPDRCLDGLYCRITPRERNCSDILSKPIPLPSKTNAEIYINFKDNTSIDTIYSILGEKNLTNFRISNYGHVRAHITVPSNQVTYWICALIDNTYIDDVRKNEISYGH